MSSTTIEPNGTIEVDSSVSDVENKEPLKVLVSPRSYQIVSTDVYTIKRNSDLSPWFSSQINDMINNSVLADDVSDLNNRFSGLEDGITLEIGQLKDKDSELFYKMDALKSTTETNIAGIQRLDVVKTTANDAKAISETTIGAWQNSPTGGGAWFNDKVSTVSNVAYSAAKSASTLTATMNSQKDDIENAFGKISDLEKQIDGVVETLFFENTNGNIGPNLSTGGNIDVNSEPYVTWKIDNTLALHTGDTYILYEQVGLEKKLISSWRFGKGAIDEPTTDADGYLWAAVSDSRAEEAYQLALNAQGTADGKVTSWYQTYPPAFGTPKEKADAEGDIWIDSDDDNQMYRWNGTAWLTVSDKRISASVTRIDEATVDVNGQARAKSSLTVDANGSIAGFVAESDGSTSAFKIYADKFILASDAGSDVGNPFEVDTVTNKIRFIGEVTFESITGGADIALISELREPGTTVIHGGNILTDTINGNTIIAGTLSANSITAGVMYNSGGSAGNYKMKIDLDNGEIHIK